MSSCSLDKEIEHTSCDLSVAFFHHAISASSVLIDGPVIGVLNERAKFEDTIEWAYGGMETGNIVACIWLDSRGLWSKSNSEDVICGAGREGEI